MIKVRKSLFALSAVLVVVLSAQAQTRKPAADTVTVAAKRTDSVVYVTKEGKRYHRPDCQYLNQSKRQITVPEAKLARLAPCKRCYPDSLVN